MNKQVLICQYRSCLANGSAEVLAAFLAHTTLADTTLANTVSDVSIVASDCQGQCNLGVTVRVLPDEIWYCRVRVQDVETIVTQHLQQGHPVEELMHPRLHPKFY